MADTTTVDYLIPDLRLHLGDTDPSSYRYMDKWLSTALVTGIKALGRWWKFKYLVNNNNEIYRGSGKFYFPSPPVIEMSDERIIILMASIIIKGGSLEENSWNVATWRDAEIYYSSTEGSKAKEASLLRDMEELNDLLVPPTKRLAGTKKGSLPGFLGNDYERKGKL